MANKQSLPASTEWPKELRSFLRRQLEARFFAPFGPTPDGLDEGWRLLLAATFRGKRLGGEFIPWAATPEECYQHAMRYLENPTPLISTNPSVREAPAARSKP